MATSRIKQRFTEALFFFFLSLTLFALYTFFTSTSYPIVDTSVTFDATNQVGTTTYQYVVDGEMRSYETAFRGETEAAAGTNHSRITPDGIGGGTTLSGGWFGQLFLFLLFLGAPTAIFGYWAVPRLRSQYAVLHEEHGISGLGKALAGKVLTLLFIPRYIVMTLFGILTLIGLYYFIALSVTCLGNTCQPYSAEQTEQVTVLRLLTISTYEFRDQTGEVKSDSLLFFAPFNPPSIDTIYLTPDGAAYNPGLQYLLECLVIFALMVFFLYPSVRSVLRIIRGQKSTPKA